MPAARQFEDLDKWHIASPDLVVELPKDVVVPAKAADRWVDIEVDPGLTEDRYLQAIETKPTKGYRVVHHVVTSMKNDDDPASDTRVNVQGAFLNEYALGKNGDVFPEGAARLFKAGTRINFNLHLHSIGQETAANVALGLKFYPKGFVPKFVRRTRTTCGPKATPPSRSRPGCSHSSPTCTTAGKRSAWRPSTLAGKRSRR